MDGINTKHSSTIHKINKNVFVYLFKDQKFNYTKYYTSVQTNLNIKTNKISKITVHIK